MPSRRSSRPRPPRGGAPTAEPDADGVLKARLPRFRYVAPGRKRGSPLEQSGRYRHRPVSPALIHSEVVPMRQVDLLEPVSSTTASAARAVPEPGVRPCRHLEDAARLLDDQGRDPDQGPQAARLRHGGRRDGDADQAGQGQGPQPRRRDRRRPRVPGAARAGRPLASCGLQCPTARASSAAARAGSTTFTQMPAPSSTEAGTVSRGRSSRCQCQSAPGGDSCSTAFQDRLVAEHRRRPARGVPAAAAASAPGTTTAAGVLLGNDPVS